MKYITLHLVHLESQQELDVLYRRLYANRLVAVTREQRGQG